MLGAGTVINPLIKIITTVVILGAVYLFIVKPALDTTNNAFDSFSDSFNGFDNLPGQVQLAGGQQRSTTSTPTTSTSGAAGLHHASAINAERANQNRIDRCLNRFGPDGR